MNKAKLFTFVAVLTAFVFSTHTVAGTCEQGIALVNPLTGFVEINGIDIGNNTTFDTTFRLRDDGALVLQSAQAGNQVNPNNRFNAATNQVELDCVVFKENTFRATFGETLSQDGELLLLHAELAEAFDALALETSNWAVDYSNNFPDDPLVLNTDGSATLATFPGSYEILSDNQITIDLGLSDLTGTVNIGQISGNFNHFGESGTFVATPTNRTETKLLNDDRFQVEVDWNDGTNSGRGNAISVTHDSAAFYFFDASNWEILVRVLDGCAINDHFWVFAGAATDVEYTLTVTDTTTNTTQVFDAPAATAISDTEAFATCP